MIRGVTAILALGLLLAACDDGTAFPPIGLPADDTAIATESRAGELTRGMTLQDVSLIVGPAIASADNPARVGSTCFSHPYGSPSAPKYLHAEFLGGHLVAASDGHDATCGPGDFSTAG